MEGDDRLETPVPAGLTVATLRRFGVVVGAAFLVFGGISRWRGHSVAPEVMWTVGGALVVAGLLIPGQLGPVYRAWMGLAHALSKITTPIFMGLIYFVVFTPIGLVRRAFGANSLVRAKGDSFWITRAPGTARRGDLKRQF
jgi:hypothetical protein